VEVAQLIIVHRRLLALPWRIAAIAIAVTAVAVAPFVAGVVSPSLMLAWSPHAPGSRRCSRLRYVTLQELDPVLTPSGGVCAVRLPRVVTPARIVAFRDRAARYAAMSGDFAHTFARRLKAGGGPSLDGDRWVEWSFCFARMAQGEGTTLDFGSDIGVLSLGAAQHGHRVTALDLVSPVPNTRHPLVVHERVDILDRPLGDRTFDQIVNCSSIEHVGLPGRYTSTDRPDGDLEAMAILRDALAVDGRMILTIPVGRDLVCAPLHRIYGAQRLPRLLEGYEVLEQQYWTRDRQGWSQSDRATALATQGSASLYALGLFVLARR
jgi:2-polyprenyl-3-methyl-5-hydroxy-6-metoxy-1,4-benzoquinol methylase